MNTNYELRSVERFSRFVIGILIVQSILIIPLTPSGIILVVSLAIYPLITSLVGVDPVFYLVEKLENYSVSKNLKKMKMIY